MPKRTKHRVRRKYKCPHCKVLRRLCAYCQPDAYVDVVPQTLNDFLSR